MSLSLNNNYRSIPFSTETYHADFYTYANVEDLAHKCELLKEEMIKCRTVGILQSHHGKFSLSDMDESGIQSDFKLQISMTYLKSPLKSTVVPYPVQVFGTLQWKNRPVIIATVLQVLNIPMAIRIRNIMNSIAAMHLAKVHENKIEEKIVPGDLDTS